MAFVLAGIREWLRQYRAQLASWAVIGVLIAILVVLLRPSKYETPDIGKSIPASIGEGWEIVPARQAGERTGE